MEFEMFDLTRQAGYDGEVKALEDLFSDETVKIRKITVTSTDHVYIFYEAKEKALEQESERLQELREIAKDAKTDTVYGKLTNAKQRNLYLCGFCHITKSDAEDVMELVKILEVEASVARDEAVLKAKEELEEAERRSKLEAERKANERKHKKELSK